MSQCNSQDSLDFTWNLTNNCQPVNFNPFVKFGKGPYTYKWDFGDNTNTSDNALRKPSHIYLDNLAGNKAYTVVLTITDSKMNSCSYTKVISIRPSPIILMDSTFNLTYPFIHCIVQGDECDLSIKNKSPFNLSHYNIDWGDGTAFDSTGFPQLLKHVYSGSNQYQIIATAPNGCISYSFFCGSNPAGGLGCPQNRVGCDTLKLDFPVDAKTLQNPPGTTYRISFEDGTNDLFLEQENLPPVITHIYTGNNACIATKVKMVATNPCGFTESWCSPISVSTRPDPDIGFVRNFSYDCANKTEYTFKNATTPCCIKFDGSKDNGVYLTWSIVPNTYRLLDGTLKSNQFTVVFNNAECYKVKLIVDYENQNCAKCGDTNVTKEICLDSVPIAKAKASVLDNYNSCKLPLNVDMTNLSINAKKYLWEVKPKTTDPFWSFDFINGSAKDSDNPFLQFNLPDTFNINLKATNNCGTSSYPLQIITVASPIIKIDKPLSFCGPDAFDLQIDDNSIVFKNINYKTSYSWSISPSTGAQISPNNKKYPLFKFNSQHIKSYMLKVTVDNNNGCPPTTDSTLMEFTDKPSIAASTDINDICKGDTVKLTVVDNSINNGNNIIYRWYQSGPLGGLKDTLGNKVIAVPQTTTTYTVKGYVKNDTICKDIVKITINVKPSPLAKISPEDTTICKGDTIILRALGGIDYSWSPISSNLQVVSVSPVNPTIYTVIITGVNGCKSIATSTVKLKPIPNVSFSNKSIEFVKKDVYFNNTSIDASTYAWSFGDGINSQDTFPKHKYDISGTYIIKLTGVSDIGCKNETTGKIKIIKTIPFVLKSDSGCSPFTVNFINNSVDPDLKYYWNFGYNNLTSNSPNPDPVTYVSNTDAVYNVTLYLIYLSDTIKYTAKFRVFTKPVANFTLDPRCGCSILSVNITNYSQSGLPFSCSWDFGNGRKNFEPVNFPHSTSYKEDYTGKPVDSTYYTIELTDSNKCGISIFRDKVIVFPNTIIVDFSPDKSVVCENEIIHFENKSKFYTSLYWDFGDSSKSSEINPDHFYTKDGIYTVKLTAYNQCLSCGGITETGSSSRSIQIKVNKIVDIDFNIENKLLCQNEDISFTSTTNEPLSEILWDFGDPLSGSLNFSNSATTSHKYKNAGIYIIKLIGKSLSANPCIDTIKKSITINTKPTSLFTGNNFCQSEEGQFINKSSNYDQCFWRFGDGSSFAGGNAKHQYDSPGDYTITLITLNNNGCTDTSKSDVKIYPGPDIDFGIDSKKLCRDDEISFSGSTKGALSEMLWDFGDPQSDSKNFSNLQNPKHIYKIPGSYTVKFIGKTLSVNPCVDTVSRVIIINDKPIVLFSDSNICLSEDGKFINLSKNYNRSQWYFGDGDYSNETNPQHKYKSPGDYIIKLIASTEFCSDSSESSISVYPNPVADFTYIAFERNGVLSVDFRNKSTDLCQYKWDFGDGSTSTEKSPRHDYKNNTTYDVKLTVINKFNCSKDTIVAVSEKSSEYRFYVPNSIIIGKDGPNNTFYPVVTMFTSFNMKIFNRWGAMLFETNEYKNHWDGRFKGDFVPEGAYVYSIEIVDATKDAQLHVYNGYVFVLRKK